MALRNVAGYFLERALPVILGNDPDPRRAVAIHRDRLLARRLDDLRQPLVKLLHAHFRITFHSPHRLTPGFAPRLQNDLAGPLEHVTQA
ncbi:hypothetical protein D3C84_790630 [compost metagenome]